MNFLKAIQKEVVSTLKNREIIILLALGPIFLTLLFGGVYYNTYVDDIPIAVLDEDNSSLSRMIAQQFEESERFAVERYPGSKEELEQMLSSQQVYMGLIIPADFSKDAAALLSPKVLILCDGTNMVISNNCYAAAAEIVQTLSAGIEVKVLEAKGLMPEQAKSTAIVFNFRDRILYDPKISYMNYLLVGYICVFFQQVMLSGMGISILNQDLRGADIQSVIKTVAVKIIACFTFAGASVYIAVLIARMIFHVPMCGNMLIALAFCLLFAVAVSCPAVILASLIRDKLKYTQLAYMLSLPTFISSGYVWPAEQMPGALSRIIKVIWPLIHFTRPMDDLLIKGYLSLKSVLSLAAYIIIWLPAAVAIAKHRLCDSLEAVEA